MKKWLCDHCATEISGHDTDTHDFSFFSASEMWQGNLLLCPNCIRKIRRIFNKFIRMGEMYETVTALQSKK